MTDLVGELPLANYATEAASEMKHKMQSFRELKSSSIVRVHCKIR